MRRLMVSGLLVILLFLINTGMWAGSQEGLMEQYSSSTSSNLIEHLPFTISETGVYYINRDLTVNGEGITIAADNAVLIGQGHTIKGNGGGIGVSINASNVVVTNCRVKDFFIGVLLWEVGTLIDSNSVSNSSYGIILGWSGNHVFDNIIFDNDVGILGDMSNNEIVNNYFSNNDNAFVDSGKVEIWSKAISPKLNVIGGPYKGGNYWHDYTGLDTDGDGLGNTPYVIDSNNRDNFPLVDVYSPHYSHKPFNLSSQSLFLAITWTDNVWIDTVILELDGANYTNSIKIRESLGFDEYYHVEYRATYSSFFILPVGIHSYRWYANDTSNHWNFTQLQSFNVVETNISEVDISPTLKVSANITCEGTSNITEVLESVDIEYIIDGSWLSQDMTYDHTTKLYTALIPEYNQLAGKTIQIFIVAKTKQNQFLNSNIYIYDVPEWTGADLNRDGEVSILDVVKITSQYGKP